MNFKDKVVVVTGAAGALGEAVVRAFLEEAATVVGTYRGERGARQLEESVGAHKGKLALANVDLTDASAVDAFFTETRNRHARVDVLVNVAGGFRGGKALHETSPVDLDALIATNLKTAFLCCHAAVPLMLARGRGRIVLIGAKPAVDPQPNLAAYGASKAALVNLAGALAAELRPKGITVNCILPSIIDTAQNRQAMPEAAHELWPKPEELARVILFLASDDAGVISGAAIPVYGRAG
jgi:NAD(P)-dependent dehydrogenase (short-subunit alcohol dehydrogenase family)